MPTRGKRESELYPLLAKWLERNHKCFVTAQNKGLKFSRMDVVGIRDIGGDLSGDIETVVVEVKKGNTPFATACGQTAGYAVYANRVYLADLRDKRFGVDEIDIASQLEIGLIQIKGRACIEVLSSPFHEPIGRLNLALLERLALGRCQMCGCFFRIGGMNPNQRWSSLAREDLKKAIDSGKGFMFWNGEIAQRKDKVGIRKVDEGTTFERRFICPDCIEYFFTPFTDRD